MAGGCGMALQADFARFALLRASEPCGIGTADPFVHAQLFNELQIWNFKESVHERDKCQGMT
jgi:hypothetical protein